MAFDLASIRTAAAAVEEPALGRSLGELDLVGAIEERRGRVTVEVGLLVPDHPWADELDRRVTSAVAGVAGVESVTVRHSVLDDAEREAIRRNLLGDPAATAGQHQGHGHAEGRAIPFAEAGHPTRVLLIASGKGGVGKSSVTVNLSVALAQRGHRVAVVDADVWGFSVPRMLGVAHPPLAVDRMIVPPEAHGVRAISMGFFTAEDQAVIWRGPMLHKALEQFLTDVWWNDPDYLLVDLPPGTGDISLSLSQFLPKAEVVIVTTPQPAAQKVAQRAGTMARKVNLDIAGVIENMSAFVAPGGERYELFGAGGGAALADQLGVPLIAQIPMTMAMRQGADEGLPVVVTDPDSEPAKALAGAAEWFDEHRPRRVYRSELKIV